MSTPTMRPHIRVLPAPPRSICALPDRRIAVLTAQGVLVLDEALNTVATCPATDLHEDVVAALPDGRLLVRAVRFGNLFVGRPGAPLEKVDLGKEYSSTAAVTQRGFFAAVTADQLLVDRDGTQRLIPFRQELQHGLVPWNDGALAAGRDGFTILDADGSIRGRHNLSLTDGPSLFAGQIACLTGDAVVLLEGAREAARFSLPSRFETLVAAGEGLLVTDPRTVLCLELHDGRLKEAWRLSKENMRPPTALSGGRVVMASWAGAQAWIRDSGGELTEVPLPGSFQWACSFGDGIAISVSGSPDVLWWRPGGEPIARLEHDVGPWRLWEVPSGFVCFEEDALYLWRQDLQGPELPELSPGNIPLDTPIVIEKKIMTVQRGGRIALRGITSRGARMRVRPGTPFRRPVTREEAITHIRALIATRPSRGGAATSDDPAVPSFEELGMAVGESPRRVIAGVRAGHFPLEPPRSLAGLEFIGMFVCSSGFLVCDPCYLGQKPRSGIALALKVNALPGRWHAYVRPGVGEDAAYTAELIVMHESGLGAPADARIGVIGVDGGRVGVFDGSMSKWNESAALEEGIFAGQCAVVHSGYGDGGYEVFVGSLNGKVVKIRVPFLGPTPPELDVTLAVASDAPARPYSPSEWYEVGESIEHRKFGKGIVTRMGVGKMDVRFEGESRTLVCGTAKTK